MDRHAKLFGVGIWKRKARPLSDLREDDVVKFHDQHESVAQPLDLSGHEPVGAELVPQAVVHVRSPGRERNRVHHLEAVAVAQVAGDHGFDPGRDRQTTEAAREGADRQGGHVAFVDHPRWRTVPGMVSTWAAAWRRCLPAVAPGAPCPLPGSACTPVGHGAGCRLQSGRRSSYDAPPYVTGADS